MHDLSNVEFIGISHCDDSEVIVREIFKDCEKTRQLAVVVYAPVLLAGVQGEPKP
jgi:hypothetical protein